MPRLLNALLFAILAHAEAFYIENTSGRVDIHVLMGADHLTWTARSTDRNVLNSDVQVIRTAEKELQVRCRSLDGARVDLDVTIPHTATVRAATTSGAISLSGLVASAELRTKEGAITIETTWKLARLRVLAGAAPADIRKPKTLRDNVQSRTIKGSWLFANLRPDIAVRYGDAFGAWKQHWEGAFSSST